MISTAMWDSMHDEEQNPKETQIRGNFKAKNRYILNFDRGHTGLLSMRLTCRDLESKMLKWFAEHFFAELHFMGEGTSVGMLEEIAGHHYFRKFISAITLHTYNLSDRNLRTPLRWPEFDSYKQRFLSREIHDGLVAAQRRFRQNSYCAEPMDFLDRFPPLRVIKIGTSYLKEHTTMTSPRYRMGRNCLGWHRIQRQIGKEPEVELRERDEFHAFDFLEDVSVISSTPLNLFLDMYERVEYPGQGDCDWMNLP
ncbi:hypothetical protein EJ08DRAFT_11550 [Tothia fuscella]|uniref:Uncharacterized protein n=1 Tax=Tothia fuscella TaxID=1048955 RepID=A0A9P4U4J3_9PEZI|nr:hypothetical protein EJ08DRAFT_11550 [Tothia fuscella]